MVGYLFTLSIQNSSLHHPMRLPLWSLVLGVLAHSVLHAANAPPEIRNFKAQSSPVKVNQADAPAAESAWGPQSAEHLPVAAALPGRDGAFLEAAEGGVLPAEAGQTTEGAFVHGRLEMP
jgi:hypothetical protein